MDSVDETQGLDERSGCSVEDCLTWDMDSKGGGKKRGSSGSAGSDWNDWSDCTAVTGLLGSTAAALLKVASGNRKKKATETRYHLHRGEIVIQATHGLCHSMINWFFLQFYFFTLMNNHSIDIVHAIAFVKVLISFTVSL